MSAQLPGSLETLTRDPLDGKYWVQSFTDINSGLVSHGLLRFDKSSEKLWIKLSQGWQEIIIGSQSGSAFSIAIGNVTSGATASVHNVGTTSNPILDFILPKGDSGVAATINIERTETSTDGIATVQNMGTATDARLVFRLPKGDKGDRGSMFIIDAQGTFAQRSIYDTQPVDFTYLINDITSLDNGYFYVKTTNGWSDKIPFRGPKGDSGNSIWTAYAQDINGLGATFTFSTTTKYISFVASLSQPTLGAFSNWKKFIGDAGTPGGPAGLSAYDIYVANGHPNATQQDFLASLQGTNGLTAYQIWLSLGNTGTEQDFINSLNLNDATLVHKTGNETLGMGIKNFTDKVGFGVTNPIEAVEVYGNISATQFIGDGSRLSGITSKSYIDNADTLLRTRIIAAETILNGKKCILRDSAGVVRYYDDYINASLNQRAGEVLEVYGYHDYTSSNFIANYVNGELYLAPGSYLKAKSFYVHTDTYKITGKGTLEVTGTSTSSLAIEPLNNTLIIDGITIIGTVGPYSYQGFTKNPVDSLIVRNCTLISQGSLPIYSNDTGNGTFYQRYYQAYFYNNLIISTHVTNPIFKIYDLGTPQAGAEQSNILRLVGNTIIAPSGVSVLDDSTGVFTFEEGINTYKNVSAPTKTRSSTFIISPASSGSGGVTQAYVDQQDALKANINSPTFTGVAAAPTPTAGTNTTQIATTAFVTSANTLKANIASPVFTGYPRAPYPDGVYADSVATYKFVTDTIAANPYQVPAATSTLRGGIKVGNGLLATSDVLSLKTATTTQLGGIIVSGGGLKMYGDYISALGNNYTMPVSLGTQTNGVLGSNEKQLFILTNNFQLNVYSTTTAGAEPRVDGDIFVFHVSSSATKAVVLTATNDSVAINVGKSLNFTAEIGSFVILQWVAATTSFRILQYAKNNSAQALDQTSTTITFSRDAEYAPITTGTYTIDTSTKVMGVCVRAYVGIGATAIVIPTTGFQKMTTVNYDSTKENIYSFCVGNNGSIQYYINQPQ